jgi:hypothetical protein
MKVSPTIVRVRASKDLTYLEYDAGRCPVTGRLRADRIKEESRVIDFLVTPRVMDLLRESYPESFSSDVMEAFQVEITWID